jgi:spoIIIJ-associated protein
MDEKTKDTIQKIIEQMLEKMGFSAQVQISASDTEDSIVCDITTDADSHFLIGQYGTNLQAIQHLARLLVRKSMPEERAHFTLDINSYRQQKNRLVVEQARAAADEAITYNRPVIMKPMSTYERRLVHMELSTNSKVSTESTGEGEERKIIVKPADMIG